MTKDEIAKKAAEVQAYSEKIPDPSMSNYRQVLASYKSVLKHVLIMIRDLANDGKD